MANFNDMLSKAKEMQEKMKEAQEAIKKIEVEGESGGNLVKVILSGDYDLKSIIISDEAKNRDLDFQTNQKVIERFRGTHFRIEIWGYYCSGGTTAPVYFFENYLN